MLITIVQIKTRKCITAMPKAVKSQESSDLYLPFRIKKSLILFPLISSLKFVVDHAAKPEIKKGTVDDWRSGMKLLAQNQNVYCKL